MARAFAFLALFGATGALGSACLKTLPEASSCPGEPVFALCSASNDTSSGRAAPADTGPFPPPPGVDGGGGPPLPTGCELQRDSCLRADRGDCACKSDFECTRSSSTCFPAPDCPSSVRSAVSNAECLSVSASFVTTQGAQSCTCGCASCAATCDGKGPVIGPNQTVRVELPSEVPVGRIGVMVRARGTGKLSFGFRAGGGGPPLPISNDVAIASSEFVEHVDATPAGPPAGERGAPPGVVELRTDATSTTRVEVDCVVVFVAK